ncbi:biopolymer transporter ExbD [candidate division KSB1 bacterium]|nr:biopolymer transporter ExbD [candidate division KSB1 bacterium]
MAFKPSQRGSQEAEPMEINIFPMMNLMVVLVPLLLSTATFVKIGVIELNLPQLGESVTGTATPPTEPQESLDLTVAIKTDGFFITSAFIGQEDALVIPLLGDGSFDYDTLSEKLFEIKRGILNTPKDTKNIILQAQANVEYQIFISTMDASRSYLTEEAIVELFPQVSISVDIL